MIPEQQLHDFRLPITAHPLENCVLLHKFRAGGQTTHLMYANQQKFMSFVCSNHFWGLRNSL